MPDNERRAQSTISGLQQSAKDIDSAVRTLKTYEDQRVTLTELVKVLDELFGVQLDISNITTKQLKTAEDLISLAVDYNGTQADLITNLDKQYEKQLDTIRNLEYQKELGISLSEDQQEELALAQQTADTIQQSIKNRENQLSLEDKAVVAARRLAVAEEQRNKKAIEALDAEIERKKAIGASEKEINELQKHRAALSGEGNSKNALTTAAQTAFGGSSFLGSFVGAAASRHSSDKANAATEAALEKAAALQSKNGDEIVGHLSDISETNKSGFAKTTDVFKQGFKDLTAGFSAAAGILDQYVEGAAQFLAQNRGQTNAYLYGYTTFDAIESRAGALTASSIIKEQDYLSTIRQLASQGISSGVETAALLQTVAEKTVPQFNATNTALRRLVRLGDQEATNRFFGLEAILLKSLNTQFGETSYLNQLFDSVNANLQDAMTSLANTLGNSSYDMLGAVQTWLSALYESGVDQGTVNKIASALNNLGSGNISGMASDSGMQKLFLLSMDKANQDYASILQEGLTASTVNTLMTSLVNYAGDIVTSTQSNNVLENAYANMFGLSMADMYALNRARSKMPSGVITSDLFQKGVSDQLNLLGTQERTIFSERINNVMSNLQYAFGSDVADDTASYLGFKGGKLALDLGSQLSELTGGGAISGALTKGLQVAGMAAMGVSVLPAVIGMVKDIGGTVKGVMNNTNSVEQLYNSLSSTSPSVGGGSVISTTASGAGNEATIKTTDNLYKAAGTAGSDYAITEEALKADLDAEDPTLTILKEMEKTLMENDGNYAFAVHLQGLSNEALRSFASIFVDENAMEDVFGSKDAKNKLFKYAAADSSSSDDQSGNNNGNGGNSTPAAGKQLVDDKTQTLSAAVQTVKKLSTSDLFNFDSRVTRPLSRK